MLFLDDVLRREVEHMTGSPIPCLFSGFKANNLKASELVLQMSAYYAALKFSVVLF